MTGTDDWHSRTVFTVRTTLRAEAERTEGEERRAKARGGTISYKSK
jgi:hypothetical protein